MQYLSPSTFSGETLSAPLDKKAIQLGRKKLFAELELSGDTTIDLHGRPFTKNDIIKYFDDLLKEDALAYHNAVGDDQVLLGFLEHARMGRKEKFSNNPLYQDEQFIQWISPYFSTSFVAFMNGCLLEPDEDGLTSLMNNKLLMTPGDAEQSWNSVTRIIMNDIATIERFNRQDLKRRVAGDITLAQVRELMEFGYIRMVQLLPQSRFASIRDKYAQCMLHACIAIFNSHVNNRSYARTFLENAELLAVTPELKTQLRLKLREMEAAGIPEDTGSGGGGSSSDSSAAAVFKVIFFALLIIIKIATCNNTGSSSNYELNKYEQQRELQKLLDQYKYPKTSGSTEAELDTDSEVVVPAKATMDTFTITHKIKRRSKHK